MKRDSVMKKNYNHNYIFLAYDVGEKRVNKVFKVCKKYLERFQLSVFRGSISPSKLISLKSELNEIIDREEDMISIIKFPGEFSFEEETMGVNKLNGEELFY